MTTSNDRRPLLPAISPPNGRAASSQNLAPYVGTALPARPAPTVVLPFIDGRMSRRKLARLRDRLSEAAATTDAATRLYTAYGALEAARQEDEKIHAARRLLPLAIEADRLRVVADIVRAHADLDAALGELEQRRIEREKNAQLIPIQVEQLRFTLEQELAQTRADADAHRAEQTDQRARRERQRQLDEQEFEIKQMELAARRRTAEMQLRQAASLAELRGEAERHKAQAEAHRTRAEAEKLRHAAAPSDDGIPEALRPYLRTEFEVARNRAPAVEIARAIRNRAAAEGRSLTEAEQAIVEIYESAAAAAESDIRRGEAADF